MKALVVLLGMGVMAKATHAQTTGSVGFGIGTVRYAGGSNQNSLSLTPEFDAGGPAWSSTIAGTLASLPGVEWYGQARGSFWGAVPVTTHLRIGGDVYGVGTWIFPDSLGTNSAEGRLTAEVLWTQPRWGIGVGGGPGIGWIEPPPPDSIVRAAASDTATVVSGRGRVRAWWELSPAVSLTATVEPTYFLGAWYTDMTLGMTSQHGPFTLSLWANGRVSRSYGNEVAASGSVEWRLAPFLTAAVGAGSYLPNPYQGFPSGTFGTAALRFHTPAPRGDRRTDSTTVSPASAPLVPMRRGDTLVVRFAMPDAKSVAIAGDWNTWTPDTLHQVAPDIWQATLRLAPGTYHFNLLVDGKDWVVPGGVATIPDGLGGKVAVLTVF